MYLSAKTRLIKSVGNVGMIALAAYIAHTSNPVAAVILVTLVVVGGVLELLALVIPGDAPPLPSRRGVTLAELVDSAMCAPARKGKTEAPIAQDTVRIGKISEMMVPEHRERKGGKS